MRSCARSKAGRFAFVPTPGVLSKSSHFVSGINAVLSYRRILPAVAFFLIAASFAVAQFPVDLNSIHQDSQPAKIHELVARYCRTDYEGARLDPQSWEKVQPMVWWHTNPDFTQIDVISRYTVETEPSSSHGKYTMTVQYRLLGIYDMATGYVPEPGATQDVSFTVTGENGEWRVADAENTYPHPSRAIMLKWLNDKISSTQDEAAKTRYQEALKLLQAQSASPFAK